MSCEKYNKYKVPDLREIFYDPDYPEELKGNVKIVY